MREDVAPMKREARGADAERLERVLPQAVHEWISDAAQHACEQTVVGRHENMPVMLHDHDIAFGAHTRVDDGDVHCTLRKVPI